MPLPALFSPKTQNVIIFCIILKIDVDIKQHCGICIYMGEQLQQLKNKVEQATSDIDWLLQEPTSEQKLLLERGQKKLEAFLNEDYPNILKAFQT